MKQLTKTLGDAIVGVSSGFDRLVFQGMIRPIMYPEGAMDFFRRRRILFKDAKRWVVEQTERLVNAVEDWSKRTCGESISYLPSTNIRKEAEARRRQQDKNVTVGPIGVWSCVEACGSYRLVPAQGAPRLRYVQTRCKHLYTYLDHSDYGFMSIRMQTWFPYRIQIAVNGREWLARQLEKAGVGFARVGNKIHEVSDFSAMQPLRKGVADTTLRAYVSQDVNNRFADHLATTRSTTPFGKILADVTRRLRRRGRTVRALDPTGKDLNLLRTLADPRFAVGGLCNKDLRRLLADTDRYTGKTRNQRSGLTTRSIRLLRDHGVIRKLPNQYRYQLTPKGQRLVSALQAALAASAEELTSLAA